MVLLLTLTLLSDTGFPLLVLPHVVFLAVTFLAEVLLLLLLVILLLEESVSHPRFHIPELRWHD